MLNYAYDPVGEIEDEHEIKLTQDNLLLIPFKYQSEIKRINRFPLLINFSYNQNDYSYYIDDFQFNSQTLGLEANGGRIREFIYNY